MRWKVAGYCKIAPKRATERLVSFAKSDQQVNRYWIYILFDGLTYNTGAYFASCDILRAMSKMSLRIICQAIE